MKKLMIMLTLSLCCTLTACSASSSGSVVTTSSPPASTQASDVSALSSIVPSTTKEISKCDLQPPTTECDSQPLTTKNYAWKQVYIDFLNTLDRSNYSGFQLIDIDDDDIPELAACGASHVVPSYLCWVYNGSLCKGSISFSGFQYLERQNLYLCEEGATGKGWDYIKRINGSDEEIVIKGELCTIQGKEYYRWDDVDYSNQAEYEEAKNRSFDQGNAQTITGMKSYIEICKQIRDY